MAGRAPDDKEFGRHPAEVFEQEIEELEKSTIRSWSSWLAGIGTVALLAGIVLMVMAYETRSYRAPTVIGNLPQVALDAPQGTIHHLPAQFGWGAVAGSGSYLVTIQRADSDDVMLLRLTTRPSLALNADDLARFAPGKYRWTVEARGADGKTAAFGDGGFEFTPRGD